MPRNIHANQITSQIWSKNRTFNFTFVKGFAVPEIIGVGTGQHFSIFCGNFNAKVVLKLEKSSVNLVWKQKPTGRNPNKLYVGKQLIPYEQRLPQKKQ